MKVRWLSRAADDLEYLYEYIAQDNPEAAASEAGKVLEAVKHLADYPASGRPGRSRALESWSSHGTSWPTGSKTELSRFSVSSMRPASGPRVSNQSP